MSKEKETPEEFAARHKATDRSLGGKRVDLGRIRRSKDLLLSIITDILDFNRIGDICAVPCLDSYSVDWFARRQPQVRHD